MAAFSDAFGTHVRPATGKTRKLIAATGRRFIVMKVALHEQVSSWSCYLASLRGDVSMCTVIWGFDEAVQWVSTASRGSPAFEEFMQAAELRYNPVPAQATRGTARERRPMRRALKQTLVQTGEIHVEQPHLREVLLIPPRRLLGA